MGTPLAFPEAQGFGKKSTGARNGAVYHVTNLNDSGAGSFRDAVSASNRFVVFDVGGYIQLKTAVGTKSDLTIAGQTAPGGGIGFRGGEISFANQSNIIMRHVRIRPGSETASTDDDALSLYLAHSVIVDVPGLARRRSHRAAVRGALRIRRQQLGVLPQYLCQFPQPEPAGEDQQRVRQQPALQLPGRLHHAHQHRLQARPHQ
jgi:pectate lyase